MLLAGCQPDRPPPPARSFLGLPISGDRASATAAGFTRCVSADAVSLRCRKSGILFLGAGPYEAALDMRGSDGQSGFRNLTLWHDDDQRALYAAILALAKRGWTFCRTGTDRAGDQAIFSKPGADVRIHMDISYWGKRRIRIFPAAAAPTPSTPCVQEPNLGLFGLSLNDGGDAGEDAAP